MYIFLDESGNFKKHNHEEYFVIGSFTVSNQRATAKAFRSWLRTRFPRKMRTQSEIKWSATGITDELRMRTIKHISDLNVRIRYGYLLRNNIPSTYKRKGRLDSGILYANIIAETLETYLPTDEKEIYIFCDQRSLKDMSKSEFESHITGKLLPLCVTGTRIQVQMIDSTSNVNIQIADWISGAISRYLENSKNGEEYFKILKNNFLEKGREFFTE
ncbi:MAG: DUF3800 domain-containing protein [Patescibacteria group bacterium]